MKLKEIFELTESIRRLEKDSGVYGDIILLVNRITRLEEQRNHLSNAVKEMLKIIENIEFESDDDIPSNDDMNRWHRALLT